MLQAFNEIHPLNKMDIQQQLNQVQNDLNLLLEKEPELENMGTTFTGVFLTPDVWYAAHDSRKRSACEAVSARETGVLPGRTPSA